MGVFVYLNPNAVELVLERRRSQLGECLLYIVRSLCQHRLERTEELDLEAGDIAFGNRTDVSRQHHGSAHGGGGEVARLGERLDHDPRKRALPSLSRQHATHEMLL